jgi:hypothetical protein
MDSTTVRTIRQALWIIAYIAFVALVLRIFIPKSIIDAYRLSNVIEVAAISVLVVAGLLLVVLRVAKTPEQPETPENLEPVSLERLTWDVSPGALKPATHGRVKTSHIS